MNDAPNHRARRLGLAAAALALFALLATLYALSVPPDFNARYRNRNLLDSDCEFIPRQFWLHQTYTHNDHLLYHVAATSLYRLTARPPACEPYDSIPQHRWIGIVSGALGIALLFLFGVRFGLSPVNALAVSLLVGGSAGWWFFSATIDTYVPHLCAAIAALGAALVVLETQSLSAYAALGACCGLAFLLRTDGVLLASLGVVAFAREPRRAPRRLAAAALAGLIVGGGGYALLARMFYGVPLAGLPDWALGHAQRPEATGAEWGTLRNITAGHTLLVFVNQFVYAVLLPGLRATRSLKGLSALGAQAWFVLPYLAVLAAGVTAGIRARRFWWMGLAGLWIALRTVFYTWWDPGDPFLFAVLSLPALWLLLLPIQTIRVPPWAVSCALFVAAGCIWWHNLHVMIGPLQ